MTKQSEGKFLRLAAAASAVAALLLAPVGAARAEFPDKPVQMTVLFGSTAKTIAQVLADEMSKSLGKPVVPLFRPGARRRRRLHARRQPAGGWLQHRVELELDQHVASARQHGR